MSPANHPCDPLRRALLGAALAAAGAGRSAGAASPPSPSPDGVPVYRTRLPGAMVLDYGMRYGMLSGSGRLSWEPPLGGAYRLRLTGSALGLDLLSWTSEGAIDSHGLAPQRFAERRLNRAEQVAEFQRAAGRIRYPGVPGAEEPLLPGMQDKVSWLLQLPAILEAEPALRAPGTRIMLFVTGARGDADLWTFVVKGPVMLALPGGRRIETLHLARLPQKDGGIVGETWLDPAREYLPLRVRLAKPDGSDALELRLR